MTRLRPGGEIFAASASGRFIACEGSLISLATLTARELSGRCACFDEASGELVVADADRVWRVSLPT